MGMWLRTCQHTYEHTNPCRNAHTHAHTQTTDKHENAQVNLCMCCACVCVCVEGGGGGGGSEGGRKTLRTTGPNELNISRGEGVVMTIMACIPPVQNSSVVGTGQKKDSQ